MSNYNFVTFKPRGIGLDDIDRCFVCGEKLSGYSANIAAFVDSKEKGEEVVDMFSFDSARLDYREYEPNRVQVKVGTCKMHEASLSDLYAVTQGNVISELHVELVINNARHIQAAASDNEKD